MHTDHKTEEKPKVTMCVVDGLFLVGKLSNGNKLMNPRIFTLIDNGARMQLSPLPTQPSFISVHRMSLSYPIPEKEENLLALYEKVTTPEKVEAGKIITLPGSNVRMN